MKKLKAYFWQCDRDAESGIAVIAHSNVDAKRMGYAYWGSDIGHDDPDSFIQQRCHIIKDADLSGITKPDIITDMYDGLKRKMYAWIEAECELCGADGILSDILDGHCVCDECNEKGSE